MGNTSISQAEADKLTRIEKHPKENHWNNFPMRGESKVWELETVDKKEQFLLDLYRGNRNPRKVRIQLRARKTMILLRLDTAGPPHQNPNGKEVPTPHIHIYCKCHGDSWAKPLNPQQFRNITDFWKTFEDF